MVYKYLLIFLQILILVTFLCLAIEVVREILPNQIKTIIGGGNDQTYRFGLDVDSDKPTYSKFKSIKNTHLDNAPENKIQDQFPLNPDYPIIVDGFNMMYSLAYANNEHMNRGTIPKYLEQCATILLDNLPNDIIIVFKNHTKEAKKEAKKEQSKHDDDNKNMDNTRDSAEKLYEIYASTDKKLLDDIAKKIQNYMIKHRKTNTLTIAYAFAENSFIRGGKNKDKNHHLSGRDDLLTCLLALNTNYLSHNEHLRPIHFTSKHIFNDNNDKIKHKGAYIVSNDNYTDMFQFNEIKPFIAIFHIITNKKISEQTQYIVPDYSLDLLHLMNNRNVSHLFYNISYIKSRSQNLLYEGPIYINKRWKLCINLLFNH